ncbi:diguanylate cyclase domain-containing protein [Bacillus sp. Marseille-P3661]|uniref:diguanylate cyclase domain-containing protein n=1 Tax=Bacillus sp. Marseille-P3661 TaxID=1936234 RepID=UPI001C64094B|nr:GGDEF domain-containing protein [Bacillus sp. Marseille-P3661]
MKDSKFEGDEFVIVYKQYLLEELEKLTTKIGQLFKNPFHHGNEAIYLSTSIGISLYPNDGKDLEMLVQKADNAMYVAKNSSNHNVQYYSSGTYEEMKKTMALER